MSTIKQTCACGATLEVTGSGYDVSFRQRDFIKAHEGHDAQPNRMSGGSGGAEERATPSIRRMEQSAYLPACICGCPAAAHQLGIGFEKCAVHGDCVSYAADNVAHLASRHSSPNTTALRDYLRANLFDGDESGVQSSRTEILLDRIVENVGSWLAESGADISLEHEWRYVASRLAEAYRECDDFTGSPESIRHVHEALALYDKLRSVLSQEHNPNPTNPEVDVAQEQDAQ